MRPSRPRIGVVCWGDSLLHEYFNPVFGFAEAAQRVQLPDGASSCASSAAGSAEHAACTPCEYVQGVQFAPSPYESAPAYADAGVTRLGTSCIPF